MKKATSDVSEFSLEFMYDKGMKDENILDFKIDFSYEGKKESR